MIGRAYGLEHKRGILSGTAQESLLLKFRPEFRAEVFGEIPAKLPKPLPHLFFAGLFFRQHVIWRSRLTPDFPD
jgi:hypothetical protein